MKPLRVMRWGPVVSVVEGDICYAFFVLDREIGGSEMN